jgi:hypothetical protein
VTAAVRSLAVLVVRVAGFLHHYADQGDGSRRFNDILVYEIQIDNNNKNNIDDYVYNCVFTEQSNKG